MKILISIDHFKEGGAERVASVLANELCKKHEVHILVMEEGINYPLNLEKIKIHIAKYNKYNKLTKILTKVHRYRQIIKKVKPDIIYSLANIMSIYTMVALVGLKNKQMKVITSERTDPIHEPSSKITQLIRNWAYNKSDCLVCQTPWVKQYFEQRIKTKCVVIPNPITPNLPIWEGENSNIIMTACRFAHQKNIFLLLESFKKLHKEFPCIKLHIWGDGELRKEYEEWINKNNMTDIISLPGFTRNVTDKMINSYMYVSSSEYEGISNSMLEALGCGVPTICTDCPVGGASMAIDNGKTGLLVPTNDVNALYSAMKMMWKDKNLAKRCSNLSRNINIKFQAEKIVKEWEKLCNN